MLSGRVQTHINSHELTFMHSLWHTNTQSSTPRFILPLTVTDALADKSPHASGRAWCWGPSPLLQTVPQNRYVHTTRAHTYTHTSHILYVRCLRLRTHTPLTSLSENPSTHTSAGIFFHSSPSPIPPSPSLSPPSLSSLTANQAGGDIMLLQPVWRQEDECVCVMGEKGRHTQTPQEY